MFSVRALEKRFDTKSGPVDALCGVDLETPTAKMTAIVGPSGCGKTTLLRILAGFEPADGGEVWLGDRLVNSTVTVRPERRNVGIVTQEGALFPHLDVASNVAYGLGPAGFRRRTAAGRRARDARVTQMLELVGLPGHERRRPAELSGGQQQRVALARALAPSPAAILLDEPFSALDAGLRTELREEVRDLLHQLGTTSVLVTHDQSEGLSLGDHLAVMRAGRIVQSGAPADVYRHPVDAGLARFLGDAVILAGCVSPDRGGTSLRVDCALGRIAAHRPAGGAPSTGSCTVMLRPEQLELATSGAPALVTATSYFGHDGLVHLDLRSNGDQVLVRTSGRTLPDVGQTVAVRVTDGSCATLVPN